MRRVRQIVKASGKTVPGKTTRLTRSELSIIEPEFIVWVETERLYPFVFESVGDWSVSTSVAPPDGFVAAYDLLSAEVDTTIEVVQFTVTEVGSDLVPTGTTFDVKHNGRRDLVLSDVDIFLMAKYAKNRGFNVAQLRTKGLIKELPEQAAFGQGLGNGNGQLGTSRAPDNRHPARIVFDRGVGEIAVAGAALQHNYSGPVN